MYPRLSEGINVVWRGSRALYINPVRPTWIVVGIYGDRILQACDGTMTMQQIEESFRKELGQEGGDYAHSILADASGKGFFEAPRAAGMIHPTCYPLSIVQLQLTTRCNLNCTYCYATDRNEGSKQSLTYKEYTDLIDQVIKLAPNAQFTLTGGEPLLHPDCMRIARYIHDHGSKVDILTNGILITPDNIAKLKLYFSLVGLSIDGSNAQRHGRTRGEHSYEPLQRAIQLLKRYEVPYRLSMTVTQQNKDDVGIMARLYGSHLRFAPLYPAGNAAKHNANITGLDYYQALKGKDRIKTMAESRDLVLQAQHHPNRKCSIGDGEISISASGDVYPCHLLHYPQFLMGNVRDTPLADIYLHSDVAQQCRNMVVENIKGCRDCDIRYICGGACRARAFHEGHDIMRSSEFCVYERMTILDELFALHNDESDRGRV